MHLSLFSPRVRPWYWIGKHSLPLGFRQNTLIQGKASMLEMEKELCVNFKACPGDFWHKFVTHGYELDPRIILLSHLPPPLWEETLIGTLPFAKITEYWQKELKNSHSSNSKLIKTFVPSHKKTCLWGFRWLKLAFSATQTGILSHRD